MNKMKSKKYRTVGTVPKSNRKIIETEVKSIIQTHTYTFWYGTVAGLS
jgi:cell division protein FtsB